MIGYQYAMRPMTLGPRLQPLPMPQGGMPPPQLPAAQAQPPQGNPMAPLAMGLGMMGQGFKGEGKGLLDSAFPMQQWTPTNDAAQAIQGGQYPDPLLRRAAEWDVPKLDWFSRMFG